MPRDGVADDVADALDPVTSRSSCENRNRMLRNDNSGPDVRPAVRPCRLPPLGLPTIPVAIRMWPGRVYGGGFMSITPFHKRSSISEVDSVPGSVVSTSENSVVPL